MYLCTNQDFNNQRENMLAEFKITKNYDAKKSEFGIKSNDEPIKDSNELKDVLDQDYKRPELKE